MSLSGKPAPRLQAAVDADEIPPRREVLLPHQDPATDDAPAAQERPGLRLDVLLVPHLCHRWNALCQQTPAAGRLDAVGDGPPPARAAGAAERVPPVGGGQERPQARGGGRAAGPALVRLKADATNVPTVIHASARSRRQIAIGVVRIGPAA